MESKGEGNFRKEGNNDAPETHGTDVISESLYQSGFLGRGHKGVFTLHGHRKSLFSVRVFEKWLRLTYQENNPVQELSAEWLNKYLTEFFQVVKKTDGSDYTVKSLDAIREGIKIYLLGSNYKLDIVTDMAFSTSQIAFKDRRKQLSLSGPAGRQPR